VKAVYTGLTGEEQLFEHEVIVPQNMEHSDGFTLFGFNSWEDVQNQKLIAAVTGVVSFQLDDAKVKMGFWTMITRVEVNTDGEFFLIIPEEVIDKYRLEEGDPVEWDENDDDFALLSFA